MPHPARKHHEYSELPLAANDNYVGGKVTGDGVNIKAANLELISQQDTSVYSSQYKNWGVNASFAINGTPQSLGVNGGIDKQSGNFASVNEQSGIYAGNAGYNIVVVGNTNLVGAVIASSADKDKNYLSTGTLTASDIENHEKYNATSVNVGFSITNTPTTNADGTKGSKAKLSASLPTAMSASGDQSSTTKSAIADGTIIITSNDTASLQTAATISHDTEGANQPLTKQYNDQMRADIADGFRATKALAGEVNTFLQNRETEKETVKKEAETGIGRDGHVLTDEERQTALETYIHLENTYGSNKPGTIALTALTGAASGNVTGSMNSLAQAVAINVVQSYVVNYGKHLVDRLDVPETEKETIRAAVQGLIACGGANANGSSCTSAAMGAAASVVLNNIIDGLNKEDATKLSGQEKIDRENLVASIVAAISMAADIDASVAMNAAKIETENNGSAPKLPTKQDIAKMAKDLSDAVEKFKQSQDAKKIEKLVADAYAACKKSNTVCTNVTYQTGPQITLVGGGGLNAQAGTYVYLGSDGKVSEIGITYGWTVRVGAELGIGIGASGSKDVPSSRVGADASLGVVFASTQYAFANKGEDKGSLQLGGNLFSLPFKVDGGTSYGGGITQYIPNNLYGNNIGNIQTGQRINNWQVISQDVTGWRVLQSNISGTKRINQIICRSDGKNHLTCKPY